MINKSVISKYTNSNINGKMQRQQNQFKPDSAATVVMNHLVRRLFTVTTHTAGKRLRRDKNHDSHSRRASGCGLYANVDQWLSGRGHVTPLDQSGRIL